MRSQWARVQPADIANGAGWLCVHVHHRLAQRLDRQRYGALPGLGRIALKRRSWHRAGAASTSCAIRRIEKGRCQGSALPRLSLCVGWVLHARLRQDDFRTAVLRFAHTVLGRHQQVALTTCLSGNRTCRNGLADERLLHRIGATL